MKNVGYLRKHVCHTHAAPMVGSSRVWSSICGSLGIKLVGNQVSKLEAMLRTVCGKRTHVWLQSPVANKLRWESSYLPGGNQERLVAVAEV